MRSRTALRVEDVSTAGVPRLAVLHVADERWVAAIAFGDGEWSDVDGEFGSDAEAARAAMNAIRARIRCAGAHR